MRFPKPNNIVAEKYVAGMSLFKSKLAKIKLSANESALGPSPNARKQYLEVSKNFARYPDSDGTFLRNTLANKFKIDKNRIIFAERVDRQMHMARICNIDIALDTRVYNGHTTSIEMLQSGVPLVTLEGKHFASRVSTSLLTALGMKDLITKDIDGYKEIVSGLIADSKALGSLKKKLIQKLSESKLMDTNFFARSFEDAILRIFK